MTTCSRTNSLNPHFPLLIAQLDAHLAERDGDDHAFYAQYNKTDLIKEVIVLYHQDEPVACGAFRAFGEGSVEIKRMFVAPAHRGKGFAQQVLQALEAWAMELGYATAVLETGKNQPEAIALYTKCGYEVIPNYGPYANIPASICMKKTLAG